jgi:hypothetical protein
MEELFKDLAIRVGDTAAIAVGRISGVFDQVEYPEIYSDPLTNPDPMFAFALLVRLRQAADAKEVDAFLAERMVAFGLKKDVTVETYKGIKYSKMEIEQKSADYRLATPCYMLVQDHLVISNSEEYFRKIINTIAGGPSLGGDPTYQATVELLPESANIGVFLDVDKLYRVPPNLEPGGRPRGWMWDNRNLWVINNRDWREEANRYRRELQQAYYDRRVPIGVAEDEEIEKKVEERRVDWESRYPQFLEERRRELEEYARLRSLGLSFVATPELLTANVVFLLKSQPGETAGSGGAPKPP